MSKIGGSCRGLVDGATGVMGDNVGLIVIASLLVVIVYIFIVSWLVSNLRSPEDKNQGQKNIEKDIPKLVNKVIN